MTNQLKRLFILTFFVGLLTGCQQKTVQSEAVPTRFQGLVDSIRMVFTPDQRVDRFRPVLSISDAGCLIFRGATTNRTALATSLASIKNQGQCVQDSMRILPITELGADTFGIVNVSVANLRTQPKHSGELTTQVLMGMPLKILDRQNHWYLVQSPERYIAWLDAGAFVQTDLRGMSDFYQQPLAMVKPPLTRASDRPSGGTTVRDLSTGGIVALQESTANTQQIKFPDGRMAYLPNTELEDLTVLIKRSATLYPTVLAQQFYGAPYLWGGTSAKGMDCSGFTKMTYLTNGYVIPRDASQQVHAGREVPLDESLSQLEKGDFLFFGNLREDGSQRITHVGIYLGDGRFVHSGADNGYIKEESLFPDRPDFAAHRRESLLRAKRLSIGSEGVVPLATLIDAFAPK